MNVTDERSRYPRIHAVPFDSEHKFNATLHANPYPLLAEEYPYVAFVKGAPDRLLAKCTAELVSADDVITRDVDSEFWKREISYFGSKGLRCLAFCLGLIPKDVKDVKEFRAGTFGDTSKVKLVMCGIVGIMDPPREECIVAIREAHQAGIQVKMITGDHPDTALAIGKMLGLLDSGHQRHYTGVELDAMTPQELDACIKHCNIFARTSPANKLQIVQALKRDNQVSCMTGDGTNDAPALRAADIGVAMGITGTDVAKEAAKMILVDDNFASIVTAVKEGRKVWDNLVKIIVFNNPVNFAQGFSVLFALILQFSSIPLTTVQVLYVNLVTSVTLEIMLALEPPEPEVMTRPPRPPSQSLVGPLFYWRLVFVCSIVVIVVLGGFVWSYSALKYTLDQSRTVAVSVLIFCQITYGFSCRFLYSSAIRKEIFYGNPVAWLCAFIVFALQVFLIYTPGVNEFFGMAPIDGPLWGICFLLPTVVFIVVELEKLIHRRLVLVYLQPHVKHYERKIVHAYNRVMCCWGKKTPTKQGSLKKHKSSGESKNSPKAASGPADVEAQLPKEANVELQPTSSIPMPVKTTEDRPQKLDGEKSTTVNGHAAEISNNHPSSGTKTSHTTASGEEENISKTIMTTATTTTVPDQQRPLGEEAAGAVTKSDHTDDKLAIV